MLLKRILAYTIDYFVIIMYAALLFLFTYSVYQILDKPIEPQDPITGNIISFITLTLPVFLYFYFFESSTKKGTIGKQIVKIKVINNSKKNIFIRVLFKIIPWEIAHFGIHWSVYYNELGAEIPVWNWVVNILPQVIIIFYFITIVFSKGESSFYDKIAKTKIEKNNPKLQNID